MNINAEKTILDSSSNSKISAVVLGIIFMVVIIIGIFIWKWYSSKKNAL